LCYVEEKEKGEGTTTAPTSAAGGIGSLSRPIA